MSWESVKNDEYNLLFRIAGMVNYAEIEEANWRPKKIFPSQIWICQDLTGILDTLSARHDHKYSHEQCCNNWEIDMYNIGKSTSAAN